MKWLKIKINTSKQGIDPVSDIFDEMGLSSLEIEDSEEFLATLEQTKPQWDFVEDSLYQEKIQACSVAAYIAKNHSSTEICNNIADKINKLKLSDADKIYGNLEIFITELDEEDWAENWKKYFKPLPVGEKILICPVWENVPDEYKMRTVFKVDPGMSFGTGTHETTRLCIQALEKYILCSNGEDCVLDLGCGSGILSIISLMLGAKTAYVVDIDENCAPIALNNAKINGVDLQNYNAYTGNLLADKRLTDILGQRKYDIVLMNIIPDVIIPLLPVVKNLLADGGKAILSGIIERYVPDVENALRKNGFDIIEIMRENDWVCMTVCACA